MIVYIAFENMLWILMRISDSGRAPGGEFQRILIMPIQYNAFRHWSASKNRMFQLKLLVSARPALGHRAVDDGLSLRVHNVT
jgi:hypothetical protein